jgi:SAM-dependent methyltransferase
MSDVTADLQARNRAVWSAGDWDAVSVLVAGVGPRLLDRIGIQPGMRVLDVGTGNGRSVAIPAAERGARVVGADLTSEWFATGRALARDAGVEVEWVEADAEALPFEDRSFDRVVSTFGHMFAPHHAAAAGELARVCAPGGVVATTTWTPEGMTGAFFRTLGEHVPPPPPGAESPLLWGSEEHVRELWEPHGLELTFDRENVVFADESVGSLVRMYEESFGPVVMARRTLGEDAWPPVHDALLRLFGERNVAGDGSARVEAEYLVTVGRRAG